MNTIECIFCRIVRKELPTELVYEDAKVIVFHDIHPKAPIHLLIVPTKHIEHIGLAIDEDQSLLGQLLLTARNMAKNMQLEGFRLRINNGPEYGQSVPHLHIHLLGGQTNEDELKSL